MIIIGSSDGLNKHAYESSYSTLRGEFLKEFGDYLFLKYGLSSLANEIVMSLE
jgi:hypothetical protein